jgi:hypothetical protein
MTLWKINCMEDDYPGMWQRWFRNQCVGVGWHCKWGYPLSGTVMASEHSASWIRARSAIQRVEVGDFVIVSLRGNRVGRLGEVTGKAIDDHQWNPLVPPTLQRPDGEMGRRIFVRWDLKLGPDNRDEVVLLPAGRRFSSGELRPTIAEIKSLSLSDLRETMQDEANHESLLAHFDYEKALSGYIATYPHHLEDGLTVHPDLKIREKTYPDRTRSDVLLLDRRERTVIVECKQGPPTVQAIQQLRRYIAHLKKNEGIAARGILVHGGSRKLHDDVLTAAAKMPRIEVVQHRLSVDFSLCN